MLQNEVLVVEPSTIARIAKPAVKKVSYIE